MIFLVVAAAVAAGVVVDATAGAETRATETGPTAVDQPGAFAGALVLKPGIALGVDREGLAFSAAYVPELSMVATSLIPSVLNVGSVRGEAPIGPRFTVRASLGGSIGALDPGALQNVFSSSAGVIGSVAALSYASATGSVGSTARLLRNLSFDVDARVSTTGSPAGDPLIPAASSAGASTALAWQIARGDAAFIGAEGRTDRIGDRGVVAGAAPAIGWRHQLGADAGIDAKAGIGMVSLSGSADSDGLYPLPVVDIHAHGLFDLAGAAKLEVSGGGGIDLSNDPLGALLEDRVFANAGVGVRATREVSFRLESSGFWSAFVKDPPPPVRLNGTLTQTQLATALVANRGAFAWAFADNAALEVSGLLTTRLVNDFFTTDATLGVSIVGTVPIYHAGERPQGTDPRAGRDIGEPPLGAPPPPGSTTIEEPPPLVEEPEPEVAPDALRGPPANVPIVETPLDMNTLKRPSAADQKKAADKKKKKDDKKGDELVEPVAPSAIPPPPPKPP